MTTTRRPRVRIGASACPATMRIPGTELQVRCTRTHLAAGRASWHLAVLISPEVGPVRIEWGDGETPDSALGDRVGGLPGSPAGAAPRSPVAALRLAG